MDIPVRYGPDIKRELEEKLRDCQKAALERLVEWFVDAAETATKTAVVVMPTGSGKTGVICSLPYWFGDAVSRGQLNINLALPILVIAPGLDILDQLESNFKNRRESPSFLVKIGVIANEQMRLREAHYTIQVIQKTREVGDLESCLMNIVLSNAQKWRGKVDADWRDLPSNLFSIVIVDEAHHLPADQWRSIVEKFQPRSKVVFFTATPYRADGRSITTDGAINMHGFAYHLREEQAIAQRIIRPIRFIEEPFDAGQIHHRYNETQGDVHFTYITKVVREVVQQLNARDQEFPLPAGCRHCAMLIASDKSQADRVARICHEQGMDNQEAIAIHSTSSRRDNFRADLLAGRIRILVIVQMLLEGFDHPPVSIAGIVTRISSAPKFAQFIGRAWRVIPGEENVEALIITHMYFEQTRMYDEFQRGYAHAVI